MLETLMQNNSPATPFVILSDEAERDIAPRALLPGGVAMLERNPSAAHLMAALRAAVSGLTALSPTHAATLMDSRVNLDAPLSAEWIQPLTPRELQILRMLSDGLPNKSIAAELQISEHTAKFHVGQILAKLGAESRTEAVTIGIRHGLVMV
jgi:DNA-binding NarL/FixJ family response regulator